MTESQDTPSYLEMAADIVSAFVSHNSLPASDLPGLLASVNQALNSLASGSTQQPVEGPKEPAVPVKKSVQPDHIVCLGGRRVAAALWTSGIIRGSGGV